MTPRIRRTNRMGRPPLAPNRCKVHLTLACELYDQAFAESRRLRVSVPEVIRRAVRNALTGATPRL